MFFPSEIMFYLDFFFFISRKFSGWYLFTSTPQSSDRIAALHFGSSVLAFLVTACVIFLLLLSGIESKTEGRTKDYKEFIETNCHQHQAKRDVIKYSKGGQLMAATVKWWESMSPKETKGKEMEGHETYMTHKGSRPLKIRGARKVSSA